MVDRKNVAHLQEIAGADAVFQNEPMSRHTTFRVGGPADVLVAPDSKRLPKALEYCRAQGLPFFVIGNGSNLLCGDGGVRGVVIEIGKRMAEIVVDGETVTAEAGALLSSVAARAASESLKGFEFAAGIPGSIGGAVVMNAGAYGGEMKDVLASVRVLSETGEILTIPAAELDLSYRHSVVPKKRYIVLSATMDFRRGNQEEIYSVMDNLKNRRVTKQPLEYPSAGSTFKRPQGYFAGKLIEDAGLRGFSVGGAQVSEKHCGFVINADHATAADIRGLMAEVQRRVKEQFGVALEPEVKFVGEFE